MTFAGRDSSDKERVRDASDIVRVIGEVVALRPKGREFVCLCPFHDDHRPSMTVVPAKQIFKCFVCGAGGDVFSFVQKYHHMEFRETLEYLAERTGIALEPRAGPLQPRPGAPADSGSNAMGSIRPDADPEITRADLVRANAFAADFFRAMLRRDDIGTPAREIIARRGIRPDMAEAFGLGAAPDGWDRLLLTLQKQGQSARVFAEAGLLKVRREQGESTSASRLPSSAFSDCYDAFRNRLMFPIHDQIGRVIAFGARRIKEDDDPKYLNSPESRLFDKSGTLYGLYQAARSIQSERTAIITEGYTDTIACHQAGITNVVATLGTALTARHASVLRRLCDTVVLLFDGDDAGQRAADRAVEVFFAEDLDVKIATLSSVTDAKDPDELLKREGGDQMLRRAFAESRDLLEYRYVRIREKLAGAGMAALDRAIEEDLRRLVDLGFSRVPLRRRMLIVKKIASITGLSERVIADTIPAGRGGGNRAPFGDGAAEIRPPHLLSLNRQARALGCLLCDPDIWLGLSDAERELLDPAHLSDGPHRRVAEAMHDLLAQRRRCDISSVLTALEDPDDHAAATHMHDEAHRSCLGRSDEVDPGLLRTYFRDCIGSLTAAGRPRTLEHARERAGLGRDGGGGGAAGYNRRVIPRPTGTG